MRIISIFFILIWFVSSALAFDLDRPIEVKSWQEFENYYGNLRKEPASVNLEHFQEAFTYVDVYIFAKAPEDVHKKLFVEWIGKMTPRQFIITGYMARLQVLWKVIADSPGSKRAQLATSEASGIYTLVGDLARNF